MRSVLWKFLSGLRATSVPAACLHDNCTPDPGGKRPRRWLPALAAALILLVMPWAGGATQAQSPGGTIPTDQGGRLFLPSVQSPSSEGAADGIIPGQYIVVLEETEARAALSGGEVETAESFAARTVESYGGEVLYTYDVALTGFAAQLPAEAIQALEQDPNVAFVEPDRVIAIDAVQSPATWGLDRVDQRTLPLSNSYRYNDRGAGVHAYIIDTGIRSTHSEFSGRIGNGYTAISGGTEDCNGHGTHVAGTVGGTTYGVAKGVTLHPVRVLNCSGRGSISGTIAGLNWVAANRRLPAVANMSLGGGVSSSLDAAVNRTIAARVTVVVAAGNSSNSACYQSPARTPNAITVGASTRYDQRSWFSNYGTCLDIFAPGSSITSAWYTSNTATRSLDGTSMAAPHVAGAAALYLAANPGAAPATVASALTSNATLNKITSPGTGSPNRLLYTAFIGAAPSGLRAPSGLVVSNSTANSATIRWNDNSDNEDGFALWYWYTDNWGNARWVIFKRLGPNVTSYTRPNMMCGFVEYLAVAAYRGNQYTSATGWVRISTPLCYDPPPNLCRLPTDRAHFYEHENCYGERVTMWAGGANLSGMDNWATSFVLPRNWSMRVFSERGLVGTSRCFNANMLNAYYYRFPNGWLLNDEISSARLYRQPNCGAVAGASAEDLVETLPEEVEMVPLARDAAFAPPTEEIPAGEIEPELIYALVDGAEAEALDAEEGALHLPYITP